MKTRYKVITVLVLLFFLPNNLLWAVDYKIASRSNSPEINECLPNLKDLVLKIRNGQIKKEDLPWGLERLYEIAISRDPTDELTSEEINIIKEYIRETDVNLFKQLLLQLVHKDEVPGENLIPGLKELKGFFPNQTDSEVIKFLKSINTVQNIREFLDLCLFQLLRPNTKSPNVDINLSRCVLEIEGLLKILQHLLDPKTKRILGKAINITQELGKKVREGGSLESWRRDEVIRGALVRFFKRIEKADIHHHLDGSISPRVALKVLWEYPKLRELFVRNILGGEEEGVPDEIFRNRIGGLDDSKAVERLKPFIEYNYKGVGEIDWDELFAKFSLFYYILNTNLGAVRFVAKEASLEDYYDDAISLVEHKISIITPGLDLAPASVLTAVIEGLTEAEKSTNGKLRTGLIPCIWKTPHFILDRRYPEVVKKAEDDRRSLEEVKRDILKELPEEYEEYEEMCREVERQVRRDVKEDIENKIKQMLIILYEARKEAIRQVQIVVDLKRRWERENPEYASHLIGVDTVGDEKDYIRWVTASALELAAQNGFKITEHLGENWHPGELRYALLRIKHGIESGIISRIGHATALGIDTKKLVGTYTEEEIAEIVALQEEIKRLIKERAIHIETNPSSNVLLVPEKKLGLITGYEDHPLRRFYEEFRNVSINTDDSWILHTVGLSGEFAKIWLAHPNLTFGDIQRIVDSGFGASFIEPEKSPEDKEIIDLSIYHPSSIINRVGDFGEQLPVLDYQRIGEYPESLITLEKELTLYVVGWEKAKSSDYGTLVSPAGMPAINMMVDSVIERKGIGLDSEIIVIEPLYGCTKNLFENWQRRGVLVHSIPVDEIEQKLPGLINERTAIIYVESITNPNLMMPSIEYILRENKGRAAILVDDTFGTTEMTRSMDIEVEVDGKKYSVDMAMLGLTKGMTGTGNIISGAVVAKKEWLDLLARYRNCLPERAEIIRALRGLRHLEIRFAAQSRNATQIISHVGQSDLVNDAVYLGNGYMIYYVFKELSNAIKNINLLAKFRTLINAVSLGQLRNLFERPSGGTHFTVAEEAREKSGIIPAGVRGSIGIEDINDVLREIKAMLEILSTSTTDKDMRDINKIFMAEYIMQEEDRRTTRYLLPKWPIPDATFEKLISDLPDTEKERLKKRYDGDKRFKKTVDIIINTTEITKYDPVTIAIHHRLFWCLLSGNHNSVIASPDESTTTHKQDDSDMQSTFASILEQKKKGFPPDGCFRLYSRLGRPGILTFELLMTLLEVGAEMALNFDYLGTSFYSERMAHKSFLEQQAEIVMMNEMMGKLNMSAEELEELRQKDPRGYHKLQIGIRKGLDKEIIIVTQPASPLFKEAMRLVGHDAVKFRVITPKEASDIEEAISDKTVLVYFDSMRFIGIDPMQIRDIVKKNNPDCVFGITDSFNLGYGNPRVSRDVDFITQVIYYEDSDYGAVIIAKNDKPLTQVWNNPYWSRKNRGVAMSEDIAVMAMWYILPYLRVFDERYEKNMEAIMRVTGGIVGQRRIDRRHLEITFSSTKEREEFLSIIKRSNLISVSSRATDEYFFINEWTSIKPSRENSNTLILRIGIEDTDDLVFEFERIVIKFIENVSGAIGKGSCLEKKNQIKPRNLNDEQKEVVKIAIDQMRNDISKVVLTEQERRQAEDVLRLIEEYFSSDKIVVFDALVEGPEDYLLAFPGNGKIALSEDFLSKDYVIEFWFHRLPEILFHEGFAEKFGEKDYEEHKSRYIGIQRKIFGEYNLLGDDLRFYINLKLPSSYEVEFDQATIDDKKINLERVRRLLLDKEFIYQTLKTVWCIYEHLLPILNITGITVEHGGTGSQKQTLHVKVICAPIGNMETIFSFALKVAINRSAREGFAKGQREEIPTLKSLSDICEIPDFGVYIEEPKNNFYAYTEGWIGGPTAAQLMAKGKLTQERLVSIVYAYLSIMKALDARSKSGGYLGIYDVQTENVMFESWDTAHALAVDIGKIDYIKPLFILQEFDRHYSKGNTELHKAIFDGVIKISGRGKGIRFLEEALDSSSIDRREVKGYNRGMANRLAESLREYLRDIYIKLIAGEISAKLDKFSYKLIEALARKEDPSPIIREVGLWLTGFYNEVKEEYENNMTLSNKAALETIELIFQSLSTEDINLWDLLNKKPSLDLIEKLFEVSFLLGFVAEGHINFIQMPDGDVVIDLLSNKPILEKQFRLDHTYPPARTLDALELNPEDVYLNIGGGPGINNIVACLRGVKESIYLDVSELNLAFVARLKEYYEDIKNAPVLRNRLENRVIDVVEFIKGIMQLKGEKIERRPGLLMEHIVKNPNLWFGEEELPQGALESPNPPLTVYIADAADMPLEDDSITKVTMLGLFRWVYQQGGKGKVIHSIREVLRVTKPGGLILHRADNPEEENYIKWLPLVASAMGIAIRLKRATSLKAQVFEVVSKSGDLYDAIASTINKEMGLALSGEELRAIPDEGLTDIFRADNGMVDKDDLMIAERITKIIDSFYYLAEKEKLKLIQVILILTRKKLVDAKERIKEQINQYDILKGRIGHVQEGVKNVLIDKDCLPDNQKYILDSREWVKRKQLLERIFPGYRFNVFSGVLEHDMHKDNTIVLTKKDVPKDLDARIIFIQHASGEEYFPIDALIYLGIGLLNLSSDNTPIAATIQKLHKKLTNGYMDINAFLKNYRLEIILPPIERFNTKEIMELHSYAVSLLKQAA